jgi:hypothetical protein
MPQNDYIESDKTLAAKCRRLYMCSADPLPYEFCVGDYVKSSPRKYKGDELRFRGAPTVPQCFAITCFPVQTIYVYRTVESVTGYAPVTPAHTDVTHERVLGPMTRLHYEGVISAAAVSNAVSMLHTYFRLSGLGYTLPLRVAALVLAMQHLPEFPMGMWWKLHHDSHWQTVLQKEQPDVWLSKQIHLARKSLDANLSRTFKGHSG